MGLCIYKYYLACTVILGSVSGIFRHIRALFKSILRHIQNLVYLWHIQNPGILKWNNRDSNTNRPRTIVVKLLRFKDKTKIFQNANKLKGQNLFTNNDFSKATLELRKDLMVEVKRLRELGKIAYLNYTKIVSREKVE